MNIKNLLSTFILSFLTIFSLTLVAADMPNDAQIAKILMETNNGEIEMAKLAKTKAQDRKVKNFAEDMIKDHSKNNKKSMKLSDKMNTTPTDSEMSAQMQTEARKELTDLQAMTGPEFDKAYMSKQVSMHEKVLANLDNTLIPNAKDKKLKKLLEKTRKDVAEHLEDAQEIQTKLK